MLSDLKPYMDLWTKSDGEVWTARWERGFCGLPVCDVKPNRNWGEPIGLTDDNVVRLRAFMGAISAEWHPLEEGAEVPQSDPPTFDWSALEKLLRKGAE